MVATVPVITIDGPGGSGKGTLSRLLAQALGWSYLDSGAIYRLLALAALRQNVAPDEESKLENLAINLNARFASNEANEPRIYLDDADVTLDLRTESCGALASKIAAIAPVRDALLQRQRDFRQAPGLIADGRDMGTVVFVDAQLKLFLTASLEKRADRRLKQLIQQGLEANMATLLDEISSRDERDANRSVAPLRPAEDAILIDCSELTIDEMLETALGLAREKNLEA